MPYSRGRMEVHRFTAVARVDGYSLGHITVHVFRTDEHARAPAHPPAPDGWTFRWNHHGRATAQALLQGPWETSGAALDAAKSAIETRLRCALTPDATAPILMVQWGPEEDWNELQFAEDLLEINLDSLEARHLMPRVRTVRVTLGHADIFLRRMERALLENAEVQVVYISAHGERDQLGFRGGDWVPYSDLARHLRNGVQSSNVTLILGTCCALDPESTWLSDLPPSINRVAGFTAKPWDSDVAAMLASILLDDCERFALYSEANRRIFDRGGAVGERESAFRRLKEAFQEIAARPRGDERRLVAEERRAEVRILFRREGGGFADEAFRSDDNVA